MNNLAQVLKIDWSIRRGRTAFAQSDHFHVLEVDEEDCRLAGFLSNLGTLLLDTNRSTEAAPVLERALVGRTRCEGLVKNPSHDVPQIWLKRCWKEVTLRQPRTTRGWPEIVEFKLREGPSAHGLSLAMLSMNSEPTQQTIRGRGLLCAKPSRSNNRSYLFIIRNLQLYRTTLVNSCGKMVAPLKLPLLRAHLVSLMAVGVLSGKLIHTQQEELELTPHFCDPLGELNWKSLRN